MDDSVDENQSPLRSPWHLGSGVLLAIIGTFLFACKSIVVKLAFAEGADAVVLLSLRMFMALPFYVAVLMMTGQSRNRAGAVTIERSQVAQAVALGFLGYYLASYLDLSSLQLISAQLERLTLFTYPALVAFLAWMFLGEAISPRIVLAIGMSYVGVWLMYGQERHLTQGTHVGFGVLLVLGSAISYSVYILFAKPIMQRIGSRRFTSLAMIGSTVFVGIHFGCTHHLGVLADIKPIVYGYGLVLAFFCTVLPSFMINEAILQIGATRTMIIGSVGPVLTMMLAISVLQEPTSVHHVAGMAVAILGVSLVALR